MISSIVISGRLGVKQKLGNIGRIFGHFRYAQQGTSIVSHAKREYHANGKKIGRERSGPTNPPTPIDRPVPFNRSNQADRTISPPLENRKHPQGVYLFDRNCGKNTHPSPQIGTGVAIVNTHSGSWAVRADKPGAIARVLPTKFQANGGTMEQGRSLIINGDCSGNRVERGLGRKR